MQLLDDFVESSARAWPSRGNVKSPYLFCILRCREDAKAEKERLAGLETLAGATAPIADSHDFDFLDANIYDLARFTLASFPDNTSINNTYFVVIDDRSIEDRTCLLVEIPHQWEHDENFNVKKHERNFNRRESYSPDPRGWIDEEGEPTDTEEIKCVRVTFEDANMVNMLDDEHETIGMLAQHTYQTNGVYRDGASFPGYS